MSYSSTPSIVLMRLIREPSHGLTVAFLRSTHREYQRRGPVVLFCLEAWLQGFTSRFPALFGRAWSVMCHEMREPMLVFVLVAELLKFQLNPALEPLFQFPPKFGKFDAFTLELSHQNRLYLAALCV